MAMEVQDLKCPGCAESVAPSEKKCPYCKRPIIITSVRSILSEAPAFANKLARELDKVADPSRVGEIKFTQASCYLRMKLYDKAIERFEEAIEENFDNPEAPFYAAVALLKGRKAFVTPKADIDKAIEYVNAALMLENRGVFNYFLAYLKYDFYERKYLNITPNFRDELVTAQENNVSEEDIRILFETLGVEKPAALSL